MIKMEYVTQVQFISQASQYRNAERKQKSSMYTKSELNSKAGTVDCE